jgi:hypothetical protein
MSSYISWSLSKDENEVSVSTRCGTLIVAFMGEWITDKVSDV